MLADSEKHKVNNNNYADEQDYHDGDEDKFDEEEKSGLNNFQCFRRSRFIIIMTTRTATSTKATSNIYI